jgi:Pyruvate/2-oxoacid:ferredoxin oxidoreductase delta subunit
MATRKIIKIDEEKCTGCGLCVPNCAEGALQIVDGKVKLVRDIYCDGLGACLGHCPEDALTVEEREAPEFDVEAVEQYLEQKKAESRPRVEPLSPGHPFPGPMGCPSSSQVGCPSSRPMQFKSAESGVESHAGTRSTSALSHWPVQLKLVPVNAPYFQNADLLIVADCVPFAYPNFHQDFLKGKAVVVGCPKLDDIEYYKDKLTEIFKTNSIKSITLPYMEVPCCLGLVKATEDALRASGKNIPMNKVKVSIRGEIQGEAENPRGAGQNRESVLRR